MYRECIDSILYMYTYTLIDGSAPKYEEYLNQCKQEDSTMMTSVMQFYEAFYSRLFDIHPVSRWCLYLYLSSYIVPYLFIYIYLCLYLWNYLIICNHVHLYSLLNHCSVRDCNLRAKRLSRC